MLNVEVASDPYTGEQISIQKLLRRHELKKASEIVEKILEQVFDVLTNYEILIDMFS